MAARYYGRPVRSFYEAFWADAPQDPEPYAFQRRRALLRAEINPGERVLDLGCGAGRFLREMGENAIGVEIAEQAARRARENTGADVRLLEPDGSIPVGHGEIDLVWCSETLEHIPDVAHALLEVRRVLKPGGRLLATVPYHPPVAIVRFDRRFDPLGQHVRFFTRRSLARTLDAAGFEPDVRRSGRMLVARATRR
jgi:SAM-dependent methyltransferase